MSKRPPGVAVGDRVRITTVHTGTITRIDDDSFVLETSPGCPMHGSFHGDGEMTWEVQLPEPPDGAVVQIIGESGWRVGVFERDDSTGSHPNVWYGTGTDRAWTWTEICALGSPPVELVPREDVPC